MLIFLCVIVTVFSEYAILIDAGSTGTKAFSFKYKNLYDVDNGLTQLCLIKDMDPITSYGTDTGLTPLADLDTDLVSLIERLWTDCVADGESNLVDDDGDAIKQGKIFFYLGATAGMRLENVDHVEEVMAAIRTTIKTKFEFHNIDEDGDNKVDISVLSGEEESLFGWIHIQFILDSFDEDNPFYGSLDMGGASTQMAFMPDEEILANNMTIKYNADIYQVYAHSYLKFGIDEAFKRSKQWAYDTYGPTEPIPHPCMWAGENTTADFDTDFGRTYVGTGNIGECKVMIDELLDSNNWCAYDNRAKACAFDAEYMPGTVEDKKYLAYSGFYYVAEAAGLLDGEKKRTSPDLTFLAMLTQVQSICAHNYEWALVNSYYSDLGEWAIPFRTMQCFQALYTVYGVLGNGYGFNANAVTNTQVQWVNEIEVPEVGTYTVSWVIGMLLYHKNVLELGMYDVVDYYWELLAQNMTAAAVTFIILFSILCVVLIVLAICLCIPWALYCKLKAGTP